MHAAASTTGPVDLGSNVAEGSYYKNGEVTLEFKGIGVVNGVACALLGVDSGRGSFAMALRPAPNVEIKTTGGSRYKADIYVNLATHWVSRVDADETGEEFSLFTLEREPERPILNPRQERGGALTFTFRGAPGRRVSLLGDFNNWDPFMDSLLETSPGLYTVTLRIPPGPHWYVFFTEGRRVLDMFNADSAVDPDGTAVSYFSLSR